MGNKHACRCIQRRCSFFKQALASWLSLGTMQGRTTRVRYGMAGLVGPGEVGLKAGLGRVRSHVEG